MFPLPIARRVSSSFSLKIRPGAICSRRFYPLNNRLVSRVEPRPIHQRQGVIQVPRGSYPADETEPGEGIRVFKNRDPVRRDCHGGERFLRSASGLRIERHLFDGASALWREDHQITRSKDRKHFIVLEICDEAL